jgi:hypothetical protein
LLNEFDRSLGTYLSGGLWRKALPIPGATLARLRGFIGGVCFRDSATWRLHNSNSSR